MRVGGKVVRVECLEFKNVLTIKSRNMSTLQFFLYQAKKALQFFNLILKIVKFWRLDVCMYVFQSLKYELL